MKEEKDTSSKKTILGDTAKHLSNCCLNTFYFCAGIVFLLLAKIKHIVLGYSPKPFTTSEIERCILYDVHVVNDWLERLMGYAPDLSIRDKHILELGPGSDLGVGLYLLSKSAKKYTAVDVYDLASSLSPNFYNAFFTYLREKEQTETAQLEAELQKTQHRQNDRLNYVCRPDFDLSEAIDGDMVDVIFSNAAFEHFNDIDQTIEKISGLAASGAVFIVSVDLRTHSRWIRDKDPNNIYRYPAWLYRLLSTRSTPNRNRPRQYQVALTQNGWKDIVIQPEMRLDNKRFTSFQPYLNKRYRDASNQMDYLTVWICAKRT